MKTEKLNEALVELKHQRALIDVAIKNLEGILQTLNGASGEVSTSSRRRKRETASYLDMAIQILEEAGKPMHVAEIAKRISSQRGKEIARASVESTIIRHIATNGSRARVIKVRPAYFGLPLWKAIFPKEPQDNAAA